MIWQSGEYPIHCKGRNRSVPGV